MTEESEGKFNFDIHNPPVSPLSGKPITTWTGRFGDSATTVDECRAELVGAYLMDDVELLELLGYDDNSKITAADRKYNKCYKKSTANNYTVTYNIYLQLGTDGLRGLANFNVEHKVRQPPPPTRMLDETY
jgi:dipeptidyl-peptidase-3